MTRKPGRTSPKAARIKTVRLVRREGTIVPIRGGTAFVKPGSIHHLVLRKGGKPDFVMMMEAARRAKAGVPLIQRHNGDETAPFWMSLSAGEMVLLKHNGREDLYRFLTAASTSHQMWFKHHAAGGKSAEKLGVVSKKPGTLNARKVIVDPLGRRRWAND